MSDIPDAPYRVFTCEEGAARIGGDPVLDRKSVV